MISVEPSGMNDLSNHWRAVTSQNRADSFVQVCKRDFVILFASQNQQWRLVFLTIAFGSFLGKLGYENHGSHMWRVAMPINRRRRRQKHAIRITALVSSAWARRSDMRGNALGSHFDPIAALEIVSFFGKLQLPKCRVNAHMILKTASQIQPPGSGRRW
jgi:hypothetical protein